MQEVYKLGSPVWDGEYEVLMQPAGCVQDDIESLSGRPLCTLDSWA